MYRSNLKIGLDVDGVIANFLKAACERCDKEYGPIPTWSLDWINDNIKELWQDTDFWRNLPVQIRPEEFEFEFDAYVTFIPPWLYEARHDWLKANLFPDKPIVLASEKAPVCKSLSLDILIDDRPKNILDMQEAGLQGIHFIPEVYGDEFPQVGPYVVRNIDQLNKLIKSL